MTQTRLMTSRSIFRNEPGTFDDVTEHVRTRLDDVINIYENYCVKSKWPRKSISYDRYVLWVIKSVQNEKCAKSRWPRNPLFILLGGLELNGAALRSVSCVESVELR